MGRFDSSDEEWAAIVPSLPKNVRGPRRQDDRRVLNGIFYILRTGAPWRDLPERYGPRTTVYNRYVRWGERGVWKGIFNALAEEVENAAEAAADTEVKSSAGEFLDSRHPLRRRQRRAVGQHQYRHAEIDRPCGRREKGERGERVEVAAVGAFGVVGWNGDMVGKPQVVQACRLCPQRTVAHGIGRLEQGIGRPDCVEYFDAAMAKLTPHAAIDLLARKQSNRWSRDSLRTVSSWKARGSGAL